MVVLPNPSKNNLNFFKELKTVFDSLSSEGQSKFIHDLLSLYELFRLGVGLPQPYYIIPDHSVLAAIRDFEIEGKEEERSRTLSFISLIFFLKAYTDYDLRLAISPLILYEWIERKELKDEASFKSELSRLHQHLEILDLTFYQMGLTTFKEAQRNINNIISDIEQITKTLDVIRNRDWDLKFIREDHVYFPPYITSPLVPKIKLQYFSQHYTNLFFRSVIESKAIGNNSDKRVRSELKNDGVNTMASLMKIKKGKLKGAGDLGLLQICDIGSLFLNDSKFTTIGLTFDRILSMVLFNHSEFLIESGVFQTGTKNEAKFHQVMKGFFDKVEYADKINEKQSLFSERFHMKFTVDLELALTAKSS
ncbi:MAG: hypothetical protein FD167_114 [bacterium]|nr:MAG: hypothetical protein FD167_114 [bacterium]